MVVHDARESVGDMRVEHQPCCGILSLGGLQNRNTALQIASFIRRYRISSGLITATTLGPEIKLTRALRRLGFQQARIFVNGNTGNAVTLWTLVYRPGMLTGKNLQRKLKARLKPLN